MSPLLEQGSHTGGGCMVSTLTGGSMWGDCGIHKIIVNPAARTGRVN